jgi:hypothetical protein
LATQEVPVPEPSRRLIGLKLALDVLDVPMTPETFTDRLLLQKATYLSQAAGIRLGYRYSWYLKGPYSPELTRDYFQLTAESGITDGYKLRDDQMESLRRVTAVSTPPSGTHLTRADWLELLASLHYLMERLGKTFEQASEIIGVTKAHLHPHVVAAHKALQAAGLITE